MARRKYPLRYTLHQWQKSGERWTSPESFTANSLQDVKKAVIAGYLHGEPRWASDETGAVIFGIDARGEPTMGAKMSNPRRRNLSTPRRKTRRNSTVRLNPIAASDYVGDPKRPPTHEQRLALYRIRNETSKDRPHPAKLGKLLNEAYALGLTSEDVKRAGFKNFTMLIPLDVQRSLRKKSARKKRRNSTVRINPKRARKRKHPGRYYKLHALGAGNRYLGHYSVLDASPSQVEQRALACLHKPIGGHRVKSIKVEGPL